MIIAFLTARDPLDKKSWSGVYYYIGKALRDSGHIVDLLGPYKPRIQIILKILNKISSKTTGKSININHHPLMAKEYARYFEKKLKKSRADFIFAPAASPEIAYLKTSIPIIYLSDITFSLILGYYQNYSNFNDSSKKNGEKIESLAIKKAAWIIYPSQWAADSAVHDYNKNPDQVIVHPLGANIESSPDSSDLLNKFKTLKHPRLLFLGVDWERKGGPIAYATYQKLREMGVDARFCICGCVPPINPKDENLTIIPFLNKNKTEDYARFNNLLRESHFLLLPTLKEAFGIVFCEASAYGLPSLSFDTGGVKGAIREGVNGFCLPLYSTADDFARKIAEYVADENKYRQLSSSARKLFEKELNWNSFVEKIFSRIQTS
jgi:glycosyltransferase involved in cell wall biosynthesis